MALIRLLDLLFRWGLQIVCGALLLVMLGAIGGQVVMRYVFSAPWAWSEELARYSMVWLAMLGAALASRHAQHVAILDLLPLSDRGRRILFVVTTLISLALFAFLFWQSWNIAERVGRQTMAALRISMSYAYAALPVGFMLMILGHLLNWLLEAPKRNSLNRLSDTGNGAA